MADILELEPDLLELEQFHRNVIRPEQPIFNLSGAVLCRTKMFLHDKVPQSKGPDYTLAAYSPAKAPDY